MSEAREPMPASATRRTPFCSVDFSNIDCAYPRQLLAEEANNEAEVRGFLERRGRAREAGKAAVAEFGFRLSDCELRGLDGLSELVERYCALEEVVILDLRCNRLESLAGVEKLPGLKMLYAHGNELGDISDLKAALGALPELRTLTLHGNPLSLLVDYRTLVLKAAPGLRSLDFDGVTRAERYWAAQARPSPTARRENVILQKLKTPGEVEEWRARVREEQAETRREYERRQREKEEAQQRAEMETRRRAQLARQRKE